MAAASNAETEPLRTQEVSKLSFKERFSQGLIHITVEPAGILFITASIFAGVCSQTLQLEKACRVNLDLGDEICTSLRNQDSANNSIYEKQVQQYVATRLAWRSAIQSIIPCMILIFVGAWSDLTGRRIVVMTFPLIGEVLQCISNIINVVFFYELPVEVLIFFDAFFPAIMGGWSTLFLGMFSFIGDITSLENRTHRLGFVQFFTLAGLPIGMGLSGVILKNLGYYAVYGASLVVHVINLSYLTLRIKDPPRSKEQQSHDGKGLLYFVRTFFNLSNVKETIRVVFKKGPNKRRLRMCVLLYCFFAFASCVVHDGKGLLYFVRTFFNLSNVKETIRVVFKKGPNKRRLRMCVLLSIVSILFGPMFGELAILYMSTRYRFGWDELQFSMFQTYNFVTHTIGTVFSLVVFSKIMKVHDAVLGIISTLSKIAGSFVYCFAPTALIFYFAPLVEILNGTSLLAMRSIVSKLVSTDELGKVNSIFGLTENLMPLVYVPLYTTVYTATIDVLPGAVFLMGATMTLPAVVVFFWLLFEHRKGLSRLKKGTSNEAAVPLNSTVEIPLN